MNNIKLSLTIMHCSAYKERVEMLKLIISKIDKSLLHSFNISDDFNKNGIWWNYKQSLLLRPIDSTHHIILQDDMLLCENFIPTILKLINKYPDEVIHYFGSSHHYTKMFDLGFNIFKSIGGIWGGSVVLPHKHFNWDQWADKYIKNNFFGLHEDDTRMSIYLELNKIPVYCITPSLTQHIGHISLIGNPDNRCSEYFIKDGNNIDFNKEIKLIPDIGFIWGLSLKEIKNCINREFRDELIKNFSNGNVKSFFSLLKKNRHNKFINNNTYI